MFDYFPDHYTATIERRGPFDYAIYVERYSRGNYSRVYGSLHGRRFADPELAEIALLYEYPAAKPTGRSDDGRYRHYVVRLEEECQPTRTT
jgi:hypothetical protein